MYSLAKRNTINDYVLVLQLGIIDNQFHALTQRNNKSTTLLLRASMGSTNANEKRMQRQDIRLQQGERH